MDGLANVELMKSILRRVGLVAAVSYFDAHVASRENVQIGDFGEVVAGHLLEEAPADSPASSPGLSFTVREWCRGHSPPLGKPDSGRQLIADAGRIPIWLQGSQVFTIRAIPKHPQSGPQRRQCNRRDPARNPGSGGRS